MLDERTRTVLQRLHDEHGDAWLEGVLDALEAWRMELRLAELECESLAGDDPAALNALLEQAWEGGLATVAQDYRTLRDYTLALLAAGVECSLGLARLSRELMVRRGAYGAAA